MFKELEKLDVKEVPRWVGTYVRTTLKDILDGNGYRGRRGRRGARGDVGEVGAVGPVGDAGVNGKRGPTGAPGPTGKNGADGIQGKRGIQGVKGLKGRAGELGRAGAKGDKGDQGPKGDTGPPPRHKWEGTRLSFEQPDGTFGRSVNLLGPGGGRGAAGRSGGNSANPGFSSISLVGTDLIFARDTAGPLGPDITVDLSGLNTGGGFAGLGIWRYRTSTGTSPTSGRLNFNNVDPEAATELYINETNDGGEDLANFLALLEAGDILYIQDKSNADNFVLVEVSSNTDNGADITIGIANVAQQGAAIANNAQVSLVISVAGGGVGSVVTALVTAADGDDITLTQTSGGNQVADTSDFFWKLGKTGGQIARGGLAAGEILDLWGADDAPDTGIIRANSPLTFLYDTFSNTTPAQQFLMNWTANPSITSNYVGGCLSTAVTFDITTAVFIPAIFSDTNRYNVGAAPGFSAITFINELSVVANDGNFNLPSALVMNIGLTHQRITSGTSTTPGITGVSFSPATKTTVSGAVMTKTDQTAVRCSPTYSTVGGSTANLGTVRGVHCFNPAVGLFQPGAGAETLTAYYGLDVNAISFGGNVSKAAVRSAIAAASNARFLNNIGTAESEFGAGDIHLNDSTWAKFGNTLLSPDVVIGWEPTEAKFLFSTFFGVGSNPLYLHGTAADEWYFSQNSGGAFDIGLAFDVNAVVFGTTAPTPNSNNWFVQFAGPNLRAVQIGGEYSDVLWTSGGSIDVAGFAVSDLQAFKINSPSIILNGGSISDMSNLYVAAMPSFGATRVQALRVLGRSRLDGHINQGSQSPAQLTGNTNDWQLAANNGQRGVVLMDSDGAYNVTGIDASFGRAQTADFINIYNISAFTITFTHQDVLSLAANRFITATGAGIAVAAGETIRIWYDDTGTLRWRHIRLQ